MGLGKMGANTFLLGILGKFYKNSVQMCLKLQSVLLFW